MLPDYQDANFEKFNYFEYQYFPRIVRQLMVLWRCLQLVMCLSHFAKYFPLVKWLAHVTCSALAWGFEAWPGPLHLATKGIKLICFALKGPVFLKLKGSESDASSARYRWLS